MTESLKSSDGEVDIVTRLWAGQSRVWIRAGEIIFTETSRMGLGPTQPSNPVGMCVLPQG